MAMMSRGEFQWAHWVRGVRERPWTWTSFSGFCSLDGVIVVVVDDVVEAEFGLFVAAVPRSIFRQQLLLSGT